jgi:hypothetical protein
VFVAVLQCLLRVGDYWEGYKLFCYSYYLHSVPHEEEFRRCKLGAFFTLPAWDSIIAMFCLCLPSFVQACSECIRLSSLTLFPPASQLVWRRHGPPSIPSHRALRATCMQLLPLVEMYCRWELQEDCGDLNALMHRFDSELVLETHALGRSLLLMLRDDNMGLQVLPPPLRYAPAVNPFDSIRSRLHAVDSAFQGLRPHVCLVVVCLGQEFFVWVDVVPLCCAHNTEHYICICARRIQWKLLYCCISSLAHGFGGGLEHVHCIVWEMGLPICLLAKHLPLICLLDLELVGIPTAFPLIQPPNLFTFRILFCN